MLGRGGKYEGRDESQKSSHPNKQRNKTQNKTETPKGTRPVSINAAFFKGSLELSISIIVFHIYMWITWRGINRAYSALAWPSEREKRQTKQHRAAEKQ